jgi:hypothetical protein
VKGPCDHDAGVIEDKAEIVQNHDAVEVDVTEFERQAICRRPGSASDLRTIGVTD